MIKLFQKPILKYLKPKEESLENKLLGGILGFTVGDALGVPVEFQERGSYQITGMIGYKRDHLPPGTWSDDTSMTLCLIENLIQGYKRETLQQLFCDWYYYGHWTYNGKLPFDIGQSTFKVLSRIKSGIAKEVSGESHEFSNGNGSLMRVLPLSFHLKDADIESKFKMIEEISSITHAHIRSRIACCLYVEMAIHLIHGENPQDSYEKACNVVVNYYKNNVEHEELECFNRIFSGKIHNYSENEIKSSGYVIDSLEAGLWCFLNSHSFEEAVLLAVNLGEDTDTIGAITGGLAGIYYGKSKIPARWVKKLARHKEIIELSKQYYKGISHSKV